MKAENNEKWNQMAVIKNKLRWWDFEKSIVHLCELNAVSRHVCVMNCW